MEAALELDVAVIGAGVGGLAVAADLAPIVSKAGGALALFEAQEGFGKDTSSRNSGVVHAGIYYPKGSLRARLCVDGKERLYAYSAARDIPYRRCGKVIVAVSDAQVEKMRELLQKGVANEVHDLVELTGDEVRARLPQATSAVGGIWSPSSGIVDVHILMATLERDALAADAMVLYRHRIEGIAPWGSGRLARSSDMESRAAEHGPSLTDERAGRPLAQDQPHDGYLLTVRDPDGELLPVRSRIVINAAGLQADRIAALAGIDIAAAGYRLHPCIGRYFQVASPAARALLGSVEHLVYPVPDNNVSLGTHLVLDLGVGQLFGPDARYIPDDEVIERDGWRDFDYDVPTSLTAAFLESARRLFPGLPDDALAPAYAGVRPKLYRKGEAMRDFVVEHEAARDLPGLINVIGFESPGLTSCLALAAHIRRLLADSGAL